MAEGWLKSERSDDRLLLEAGGEWTLPWLVELDRALEPLERDPPAAGSTVEIRLGALEALDSAGAWLVHRARTRLAAESAAVAITGAAPGHTTLLERVESAEPGPAPIPYESGSLARFVAHVGSVTLEVFAETREMVGFLGRIMIALGRTLLQPGRLRMTALTHHLEHTGLNAMPIVGLLAFLIGIVLAYQSADQLRQFGAEIFTIDLLAVSILREIGILITAIIVAGRSGSAFTAQIGTMKVNEEVDALQTLGLDPIELLVLPRILALLIALPLLAFFANVMALFGGGVMSLFVLDMAPAQYVRQLGGIVDMEMFLVGMVKAPVFAFVIAMVGCFEGLKVAGSSESVGRLTTRSVVVSIFLVIVVDALFSIAFSIIGI